MYASNSLLAAALLLCRDVNAAPGAHHAVRQAAAAPTDPWVTVDPSGVPKTVTPVLTTISGTPTVISGAPNAITGTVFTVTNQGDVRVSTGTASLPQPTATSGAGSFPICHNKDGPLAPFCSPVEGSTVNPGSTYYITWDPTFFNGTNTTVQVTGSYFNRTTGAITREAFSSGNKAAAWSFFQWTVNADLIPEHASSATIALNIAALQLGGQTMTSYKGPLVTVAAPEPYRQAPPEVPNGPALYIGLPTILGFIAVVLIGTCIWNRKSRRIGLGNVMSRARHGYGIGKSGRERRRQQKKEGIRLMEREVQRDRFRDEQQGRDVPRRDSDALGSLAGTPTEERNMEFPRRADGGNAFREELRRQDGDRF